MEQVHTMRKYEYYDRDTLCSIIDVDCTINISTLQRSEAPKY